MLLLREKLNDLLMSDSERGDEKQASSDRPKTPKPTKETYLRARFDYETGDFQDLKQLSSKYNLNYQYLRLKVIKEKWKKYETVVNKVSQKIAEKAVSRVDSFFERLEKKGIYYEKLVEASQAQASCNKEGIPQLEPVDLEKYARVESIAIDWQKTALGISDKSPVNVAVNVDVASILDKIKEAQKPGMVLDVEAVRSELKDIKLIEG